MDSAFRDGVGSVRNRLLAGGAGRVARPWELLAAVDRNVVINRAVRC